jgi:hypothetical protein
VVQRAAEHGLPGEAVVSEEAETTEVIHAAAHPGRVHASESEAEAGAATTVATDPDASSDTSSADPVAASDDEVPT